MPLPPIKRYVHVHLSPYRNLMKLNGLKNMKDEKQAEQIKRRKMGTSQDRDRAL